MKDAFILAPRSVQALVDPAKLVFRTLVGPVHPSHIYLVKRRFQLMTPAAARFWAFAQQYVAQGGLAEEGGK